MKTGTGCCCVSLTGAVGTEASQQLKANVSLHTHRAGVDLEDVCATLRYKTNTCERWADTIQFHDWSCSIVLKWTYRIICVTKCSPPGQAGWTQSSCPNVQVSSAPGPVCPACWWPSALWCCLEGRSRPAGWWAPAWSSGLHCLHRRHRQNEHLVGSKTGQVERRPSIVQRWFCCPNIWSNGTCCMRISHNSV